MNLYIEKGLGLFHGRLGSTELHQHHAIQITISHGKEFAVHVEDISFTAKFAILREDVLHQVFCDDSSDHTFIYLDPESTISLQLKELYDLNEKKIKVFDEAVYRSEISVINTDSTKSTRNPIRSIQTLLNRLVPLYVFTSPLDDRVKKVITFISSSNDQQFGHKKLSDIACLSESRLSHLFTQEVGIPIKKYLLWSKLQNAIDALAKGMSLSSAAHEAGFADAPHFSRTFKEMFGISLAALKKL